MFFNVIYDKNTDILDFYTQEGPANQIVKDNFYIWRYNDKNSLIGVMVINAKELWYDNHDHMTDRVGRMLGIDKSKIGNAVEEVFSS